MATNAFTLQGATQTSTPQTSFSTTLNQTPTYSSPTTPVSTTPATTSTTPYSGPSIVDYLNSQKQASDYASRTQLASKYGIQNYTGTADQNTQLLKYLQGGTSAPAPAPTSATTSGVYNPTPSASQTQNYAVPGLLSQATTTSQPDTTYAGIISQLVQKSQMSPEELALNQKLAELKTQQATAVGNEQMAPETNAYQTGRIGIINQVSQAQQANTAQQAENLAKQREVAGNVLGQAAGFAKPITGVPYGTQVYNPQTNSFTSGGSAFQGGQIAGEQALGQQYAQNTSANNQAVAIKNQIISFLNTTPINPSSFTDLNSVIGLLSGKVSDPKYAQLSAQLTEYLNTLAPILGVGGDTTNLKTQIAQSMLDGRMQPAAIAQVLDTIEQTALTKLQQQQFGGGTQVSSTSNSTPSGSLYSW